MWWGEDWNLKRLSRDFLCSPPFHRRLIGPHFVQVIKARTLRRTDSSSHGAWLTELRWRQPGDVWPEAGVSGWTAETTQPVCLRRTHKRPCDQLRLQASRLTQGSSVSITLKCQVRAVMKGRANVGMKVLAVIKASGVNGYWKRSFCSSLDRRATILTPQDQPQSRD